MQPETSDRLLIMDDDAAFGKIACAVARTHGFTPHYCGSLIDLGSFARLRQFDLAIVDYFLESMRGDEIAEYVDTFFSDVPVLIVSAREFDAQQIAAWPAAVRGFVSKSLGTDAIMAAARRVLTRDRLLKRFAGDGMRAATGHGVQSRFVEAGA